MSYAHVWEFVVREDSRKDFIEAYCSAGTWDKLFRMDERFLETEFLGDVNDENRFMTVDHWESKEAMEEFRVNYAYEFKSIDDRCDLFTESESYLGEFNLDKGEAAGG